jgi:hypothetical protein
MKELTEYTQKTLVELVETTVFDRSSLISTGSIGELRKSC